MQQSLPSNDDLRTLSNVQGQPCLTITFPTDGFAADPRMGSTRMKNLLRAAGDALTKAGHQNGMRDALLEPLRELVDKAGFWRQQDQGVAMYVSPGLDGGNPRIFRTQRRLPEEVAVGQRFHLSSLLPCLTANGVFYVLVVGKERARFFRGENGALRQVQVEGMPASFDEIEKWVDHQRGHHFSPGGQGRTPGGQTAFAGHGADANDQNEIKRRIVIYMQQIDRALKHVLGGRRDPLVLVALEYLHPLWGEACTQPGFLPDTSIHFDAEILNEQQIFELVWPRIEPIMRQSANEAVERVREGLGNGLATTEVGEVLPAAAEGRVGTLLVAEQPHRLRGRFDAASRHLQVHHEPQAMPAASGAGSGEPLIEGEDAEDLIDRAVVETLNHGGEVLAVPVENLPDQRPMAALLRY